MSRYLELVTNAACRGADPYLFDATDPHFAGPALAYCRTCPVIRLCEIELDPQRNHYDGVVGGLVYRHGTIVEQSKVRTK